MGLNWITSGSTKTYTRIDSQIGCWMTEIDCHVVRANIIDAFKMGLDKIIDGEGG